MSQLVWKSRQHLDSRAKTRISNDHEYVLAIGASSVASLRGAARDKTKYSNPDNDQRGPWMSRSILGLATVDQRPNLHYDLENPDTGVRYPPPIHTGWRYSHETMSRKISEGRILFPSKANGRPREKMFLRELQEEYTGFSSVIADVYTAHGSAEIRDLFGALVTQFPKPSRLVSMLLEQGMPRDGTVIDYFAGSGTTGHAAIDLNRRDGGARKYILVEMGEYFDTLLLPRLKKAIGANEWRDGMPAAFAEGSHALKYIVVESYDDALDNLELCERTEPQQQLLDSSDEAREDYMLSYMLDVETRASPSLLNIEQFRDPFNYKLKVTRNNETSTAIADLVETFNYLIGLRVDRMEARVHRTAEFERDEHGRLQVMGSVRPCGDGEGWTFRTVRGRVPSGDRVLVIWRVLTADLEKDNLMLDTFCTGRGFGTRDMEFELIYVNGDNSLQNLRRDQQDTWEVQLIEESFHRLMFDVPDA